jgi:hypothetical protein
MIHVIEMSPRTNDSTTTLMLIVNLKECFVGDGGDDDCDDEKFDGNHQTMPSTAEE